MMNLTDDNQAKELCFHALDKNYPAGTILGSGILFIATLVARIHKESGDSVDDICSHVFELIKMSSNNILNKESVDKEMVDALKNVGIH